MSESKDTETISRIEGMLEDLSLHGLNEVMEACKDRIAGKQNEAKSMLIEQFRSQAAALGLSLESLFPGGGRKRATGNIPVKYRDPVDASRVWSGRGMMAAWLRERQERGEDIEKYRVSETTAS